MTEYSFYHNVYLGEPIPEEQFARVYRRAQDKLAYFKRVGTVTAPGEDSEQLALCAMAEALWRFARAGGEERLHIGSVTLDRRCPAEKGTPADRESELIARASVYLHLDGGGA